MNRIAVNGSCGRMGKRITELAFAAADLEVAVLIERSGHPEAMVKIGGFSITDDPEAVREADVIIDFTCPEATLEMLKTAVCFGTPMVIGTTGFIPEQVEKIKAAAEKICVVFSPNMSVGVNILFDLVGEAAEKLKNYKVSIRETHHVQKKDAPSGTAKHLAEIVETRSGQPVQDIDSVRTGDVIGDHEVRFQCELDEIVLSHSAKTRDILAEGALEAARWVIGKKPGLYGMRDVLGLK